jgi:predicted permease
MLGIGATAAVFTVVYGVLLRPLPYANAEQLVDLSHTLTISGLSRVDLSDATYMVYRDENRAVAGVGAYRATAVNVQVPPRGSGADGTAPERVAAAFATGTAFQVLGAPPRIGRALRDDDGQPGAIPVVVLSNGFWRRALGGDSSVLGRRIVVEGVEREVVGIMPPSFRFPESETALWLPLLLDPTHTQSAAFDYRGIARLKPGVTPAAAETDLRRLLPHVPEIYPGRLTTAAIAAIKMQTVVRPLRDLMVGDVSRVLWLVLGAVGALLLLACANVANLFLARAEGRHRELAVRRALGAGRGALLTEFLSEAVVLAAVGSALGVLLAWGGVRLLQSMPAGATIPRLFEVHIDATVLAFTTLTATLAALLVSGVPVLRAGKSSLSAALMSSAPSASGGRSRSGARRALVVAQVALALVLLAVAGLFARSFARLRAVDPGFDANGAVAFRLALPMAEYPTAADASRLIVSTLETIDALPGVQSSGVITKLPLDAQARQDSAVFIEDRPLTAGSMPPIHQMLFVSAGYFRSMGIPLVAGRLFPRLDPSADPARAPREVLVSQAFAEKYWKGTTAVGRRIKMNFTDPWSTIVGVVGSVHDESLEQPPAEVVYSPLLVTTAAGTPWTPHDVAFVMRTSGATTAGLLQRVQAAVRTVAPALPMYRVMPVSDLLSRAAARTSFTLLLLGVAAVVAMGIGAMGIYGVIAYLVSLRTREMGVRLALGARPAQVRRMVTRHALADAMIGVAVGLLGAAALTRVLATMLFGVHPMDPVALGGAAALLLLTALVASWLPARRAAALDPASVLRLE